MKNTTGVVKRWSKHGWIAEEVSLLDEIPNFRRPRVCMTSMDVEFATPRSEMSKFTDIHNEIMYGPIGNHIDELSNMDRMLFEMPDKWHIVGNRLFDRSDEESCLHETGNWGIDQSDADLDVLSETPSISRIFLEQAGILPADAQVEEVTDILGAIGDGAEVPESPYGLRVDVDINRVSVNPRFDIYEDEIVIDNEPQEDSDDTAVYEDDDVIMQSCKNNSVIGGIDIPQDIINQVQKIRSEYEVLCSRAKNDEEKEMLSLIYEQALDGAVGKHITSSLNSPYCGHGYRAPRRMHKFIQTPKNSEVSDAAEERIKHFNQLFGEAASCDSINDLHGNVFVDTRTKTDGVANPNYGRKHRPGGFIGKIRGMYQHDKELANQWSIKDKLDANGKVVQTSAFNLAKREFVRSWREEQKGDEESLRVALWVMFDREAKNVDAVYDKKTGKLISSAKHYKDSIWRQKRTSAFQDLFLTRTQWDAVYAMVGIVKDRLKMDTDPTPHKRHETIELLADYFTHITNLFDLAAYTRWAQKRVVRGGKVIPCKLDLISFLDESRWRQSVAKKKNYLIHRQVMYQSLRDQIISSKETQLPEQYLTCTDPKCNCMAIGTPTWYEIQDGKGLLGIPCDGCKKVVWLLGHKDIPILKIYGG